MSVRLNKKQKELLRLHYDRETLEDALERMSLILDRVKDIFQIDRNLRTFPGFVYYQDHYFDDSIICRCLCEIDKSKLETDAEFVGIVFWIKFPRYLPPFLTDEPFCPSIFGLELVSNHLSQKPLVNEICIIDPISFNVVEWLYPEKNPNVDYQLVWNFEGEWGDGISNWDDEDYEEGTLSLIDDYRNEKRLRL